MLRSLLWAVLLFFLFRLIGRWLIPRKTASYQPPQRNEPGILVQDKVCGTFVDRSRALIVRDKTGTEHFFCSEACRKKAGHV